MSDANQNRMLSIKELNELLYKLQNKEELPNIGKFSEVDILFVAGLFLWYKQHEKGWKKIPPFFNLSDSSKIWDISHYFKQIDELYNIKHYHIFDNFPIYSLRKESFSRFFVPPIYVTEQNLYFFFGDGTNENINRVKKKYIDNFYISDFINKTSKIYRASKNEFANYEKEIKERLNKYPPIFTFVFIVASKNLAIKKRNESFTARKDYIEKLFLFTQDYTRGLYEIAKNIVEHSGHDKQKGEGMITIRAYNKSITDKTRILETHVFDYGGKGIVPKLIEYTNETATGKNIKNKKIKDCYVADAKFFHDNKKFKLKNFVTPVKGEALKQQMFRHTSHYGINKLFKLIQKPLNGEIFVASKGIIDRDYLGENAEDLTLRNGTHYYFKIPFIMENFKNIEAKPFPQENLTAILGETSSLEFLSKINIVQERLTQLSKIPQTIENSLIEIILDDEKVTKENIEKIYALLNRLYDLKDNNRIAINIQDKFSDVSVLLRFLSYLTFEYKQPFIVYNVYDKIYNELLADNKDFHESRQNEAYWHNEQAVLLFVKTNRDFYFADILFGKDRNEFLLVNNIVSKTFPNTITLLQEIDEKKKKIKTRYIKTINSNQNLRQFFYPKSNILLPYDTLLKEKNANNPLFLSNLATVLQNPQFNRKDTYKSLNEYIDNFDGFRISNTHFRIGTKIHSEDFYYAKRLFQNSFFTARLAMLLAINIKEKITDTNQFITLVGYEMYSELLLSLIEKFLKDFGFKKVKENEDEKVSHFITQSEDENFKFLPNNTFRKYLENYENRITIIIVPIAATGSTANKIENDIRQQIYKQEKKVNKRSEKEAKRQEREYQFFEPRYNILLAQPDKGFEPIKKTSTNQTVIINLPAKWHSIKDCPLCFGIGENGNKENKKVLFETDKSSLTPALIFVKPKGKIPSKKGEVESKISFDSIKFQGALKYKKVLRNNNYRIYYIESEKFVEINLLEIKIWLKQVVKKSLELDSTDKVVIVAPCHESNSRFLNLVNEIVFSSSATIIHYQNNVDYVENFKILNKNYLNEETKLFFVDDSLITGKHFYEVFDLVKDIIQERILPFTATIFLKDKSEPYLHNQILELSNLLFAFANFNQPPVHNLLEQRPLEHEMQRYETLSRTALHDVTIELFQNKADSLNPAKLSDIIEEDEDKIKEIRRLKSFEATHKIYDFFAKNPVIDDYDIRNLVNFKEYNTSINMDLFPEYTREVENKRAEMRKDNHKALLKVLSQYPFILYQQLREKSFDWLSQWLDEIIEPNEDCFVKLDYDDFQTLKFLLRRAVLLGNYQVLEKRFLQRILFWFIKIDKYLYENKTRVLEEIQENNLLDFPIYVLRNYVEMIQKNGWVAYHILKNIKDLKSEFLKSKQGTQFLDMLQMESALVIDDFYEMITKEKRFEWRNMFKDCTTFIEETDKIASFFSENQDLLESNKYLIIKETFFNNSDQWIKPQTPFVNYLWIKQLLFVDCIDKDSHFPKDIDYQRKIDIIIEKMIEFFSQNQVHAFFIVTDGQQKPYVLKDEQNLLNDFNEEFDTNKKIKDLLVEIKQLERQKETLTENEIVKLEKNKETKEAFEIQKKKHKTQILIDFLNGIECSTGISSETTAEFYRHQSIQEIQDDFYENSENKKSDVVILDLFSDPRPNFKLAQWVDAYYKKLANLPFMPKDSKWLYLLRITKRNEHTNKFDALGLIGFYSSEHLFNYPESLLPRQLLMLLRRDIGRFIEKHHKNEEFAGLIQQKEKSDYQFLMKHGVNDYTNAIHNNLTKTTEDYRREYIEILFKYLVNKFNIISKLSTKIKEYDDISFERISIEFEVYNFVFTFYSAGTASYSLEQVNKFVNYNVEIDYNSNVLYKFPKDYLSDLVFELLFNIRKHIIIPNKEDITETDKLHIKVHIKNKILYVENNHCTAEPMSDSDKSHGLNLLDKIWRSYGLGKVTYGKTENDMFIVEIPLIISK